MTKLTNTEMTLRAALLSRRSLMKSAVALGAVGFAAPIVSRDAMASSGELNYMGWAGYDYKPVTEPFTAKTGIKVNFTEQPDNDTIFAQAKLALQTGAFDVIEPTVDRVKAYSENGIVQPWDTAKIGMDNYLPGMADGLAGDMATIDGKRLFLPGVWGTEALVYKKDEKPMEYGTASLADLFADGLDGKVTVRAHSALAALGRVMDAAGKLPKPFMDSYKDDAVMKENWDVILAEALKHKANIVQFWKGENEAQAAFRTNGAVLGLCWDSTGFNMGKEGPYGYIAPKEGAFAWNQGYMLMKNAKNVEQGHAWANWMTTPEGAAAMAKIYSSNPVAKGAIELADPAVKDFYLAALPGDATAKLWWWPVQTSSYLKLRAEYADKFIAG
jgi:spermidine/putrescine transport system substrate-binding protein